MSFKNSEIEQMEREYDHVVAEMARYDSDSRKLASILTAIITAMFAVGAGVEANLIFMIIPIVALIMVQYLLSNHYSYKTRETYVYELEKKLRIVGVSHPQFYSSYLRKNYVDMRWYELALAPFNGALSLTVVMVLAIAVYSLIQAINFLANAASQILVNLYYSGLAIEALYVMASVAWSYKHLRDLLKAYDTSI